MTVKSNLPQFRLELDKFVGQQVPELAVLAHSKVTMLALRKIVRRTPVDTGRCKLNWQTTLDRPAEGVIDGVDPTGDRAIAAGLVALQPLQPYGVTWICNNLPYAERLENGHSERQAPQGMVAITLDELNSMVLREREL